MKRKSLAAAVALLIGLVAYTPKPASATFIDQLTFGGTSGGSANAQTVNIPNLTANTLGVQIRFIPGFTNTGPTQVNVSGLGLVNVLRPSSIGLVAFSGQEFLANEPTTIEFNGSNYVLARNIDLTPIGRTVEFRGTSAPRGTLIEDGSCVSTTTFAALNTVIGGLYGTCSAGLFALPDSRGSLFAALDTQGANGAANRITSAGSGCAATSVGTRCGTQNYTQLRTDLPNVAPTFAGAAGSLSVTTTSLGVFGNSASFFLVLQSGTGGSAGLVGSSGSTAVTQATSTGSFTPAGTVQSLNGGVTQTAMPHVNPVLLGLRAIKY